MSFLQMSTMKIYFGDQSPFKTIIYFLFKNILPYMHAFIQIGMVDLVSIPVLAIKARKKVLSYACPSTFWLSQQKIKLNFKVLSTLKANFIHR